MLIPYSVRGSQTVTSPFTGQVTYGEAVIYYGTVRARVGYAFDHFLLYGTGGLAWTFDQVTRTQIAGSPWADPQRPGPWTLVQLWRLGWAAGAGVEIPVTGNWTAKAEYLWTGFGRQSVVFPSRRAGFRFRPYHAEHPGRPELPDWRYAPQVSDFLTKGPSALETDRFAFHGQATYRRPI